MDHRKVKPLVIPVVTEALIGPDGKGKPEFILNWPDGGVSTNVYSKKGEWSVLMRPDNILVIAQEPEQRLYRKIVGQK